MTDDGTSEVRTLDPVVVEALKAITQCVYHRRGPRLKDKFRRYYGMPDRHSRDFAIAVFKHLRHGGLDVPPFLVRRWAIANGWKQADAQLLDDYAAGVLAGVQYHHADPCGRDAINGWRSDAEGKGSWRDTGRPEQGVPLTRRE
ncbi:MAG TPA: hypothetical protein VNE42_07685 [Acidimicrobiales bacterium]|nr:hypothetical protein [Acidimicrobiales bacterium]